MDFGVLILIPDTILRELAHAPDKAWHLMQQKNISLSDLLDLPASQLNYNGMIHIANLTAQSLQKPPSEQQKTLDSYYKAIDQLFGYKGQKPSSSAIQQAPTAQPLSNAQKVQQMYNQHGQQTTTFPTSQPLPQSVPSTPKSSLTKINPSRPKNDYLWPFLMPKPEYLKNEFWDDLLNDFGRTFGVVILSVIMGAMLAAFPLLIMIKSPFAPVAEFAQYPLWYAGSVFIFNVYLYKHRGYRWL